MSSQDTEEIECGHFGPYSVNTNKTYVVLKCIDNFDVDELGYNLAGVYLDFNEANDALKSLEETRLSKYNKVVLLSKFVWNNKLKWYYSSVYGVSIKLSDIPKNNNV